MGLSVEREIKPTKLYFCAFLSGFAALLLELYWSRMTSHLIGADAIGESLSLGATLGGIGLGAFASQQRLNKSALQSSQFASYALKQFVLAELAIVCFGALSIVVGHVLNSVILASFSESSSLLGLQVCGLACAILPCSFFMGASFPALVQAIPKSGSVRWVYSSNIAGAVFAIGFGGLIVIPGLGLHVMLALSLLPGLIIAGFLWKRAFANVSSNDTEEPTSEQSSQSSEPKTAEVPSEADAISTGLGWCLALLALLSGVKTMSLEIVSTRMLRLILGGGAEAFVVMLLVFIIGLTIGSVIASLIPRRNAILTIVGAEVLALLSVYLFQIWLPGTQMALPAQLSSASVSLNALRLKYALQLLLPLAIPCGITFPLLLELASPQQSSGDLNSSNSKIIGWIYGLNSVGSLFGALGIALYFLPTFGSEAVLQFAGVVSVVIAAGVLLTLRLSRSEQSQPIFEGVLVVVGGVLLWLSLSHSWDMELLSRGYYANLAPQSHEQEQRKILFAKPGLNCLVTVEDVAAGNVRLLRTHGKVEGAIPIDASKKSAANTTTALALAAFPSLLTEEVNNACVIGLGTGVTTGAMLTFDYKSVDVVEIEPAVVAAVNDPGELFQRFNGYALEDKRCHVHIRDAVGFLKTRPGKYDVITSQPSDPWLSGASILLTEEFYLTAREALTKKGVFCQWLQLYSMDREALATAIRTFLTVFPDCHAFHPPGRSEILLVGHLTKIDPYEIDVRMKTRGRKYRPEARRLRGEAAKVKDEGKFADLFASYLCSSKALKAFAGEGSIESVYHPSLAYRSSAMLYEPAETTVKLLSELATHAGSLADQLDTEIADKVVRLVDCGRVAVPRNQLVSAQYFAETALALCADVPKEIRPELKAVVLGFIGDYRFNQARHFRSSKEQKLAYQQAVNAWVQAIQENPEAIEPRTSLAIYQLNRKKYDEALKVLEPGLNGKPEHDAPFHFLLGRIHEAKSDFKAAKKSYKAAGGYGQAKQRLAHVRELEWQERQRAKEAGKVEPPDIELLYKAGRRLTREGRLEKAVEVYQKVLSVEPNHERSRYQLARILLQVKQWEAAEPELRRLLKSNPDNWRYYRDLAISLENQKRVKDARDLLMSVARRFSGQFSEVNLLLEVARLENVLKRYRSALKLLNRLETRVPSHILGLLYRGQALIGLGEIVDAKVAFEKYLKLAPANHPARIWVQVWMDQNK